MNRNLIGAPRALTALLATVCCAAPLAAQENSAVLEEVVVTAEKRAENLQDIPISISAISGDLLRRLDIRDTQDLADYVPNLSVGAARNEVIINIRGIQSNNTTEIGDPAVALHLDGVYLSRPRGAAALFYDVERVEVLRGPQGTLYGRNATAGNINIVTKKPTNEFGSSGEILFGNYNRVSARGVLNVPVVDDKFMLRGSFMYDKHDGYNINDRVVPSIENSDDADDLAFRLHALWKVTDRLSVLLSGRHHKTGGVGPTRSFVRFREDPSDIRVFSFNTQPKLDVETAGLSAEINYDFGNVALTYIGARSTDDVNNRLQDLDQTTPAFGGQSLSTFGPYKHDSTVDTHELRLASTATDSRIDWLAGVYYFKEDQDVDLIVALVPNVQTLHFDQGDIGAKSKAAFGQMGFKITDQLELVGGLRYTDDEKHRFGHTDTIVNGMITAVSPNIGSVDSTSTDWKAGINWHQSQDTMYHLSVSTGYKAGGFNDGVGAPYNPEEVTSYELGTKNMLLNGRVQLNAAVFYMDYTDLQVSAQTTGPNGLPGLFTLNAAEATVQGVEIEGQAALSEAGRLFYSVAYLDAEYDKFVTIDTTTGLNQLENLAGKRLVKAPEWTFTLGADYAFSLGGAGTLTPRVQFHYSDKFYLREFNKPVDLQKSYTKTDLVLTYDTPGERFYVEAFVKNLEDEDVGMNLASLPGHGLQRGFGEPRTYGIRFGFNL